jgi:hypothetical protein
VIFHNLCRKHFLEEVISDILHTFWMKILLHRMQKEMSFQVSVIHLLHKFSVTDFMYNSCEKSVYVGECVVLCLIPDLVSTYCT